MSMYDTNVLIRVVQARPQPQSFLLDRFFGLQVNSESETISFDVKTSEQRLAPLVSPMVQGKIMDGQGFTTDSIKPGYVKPKHAIDPSSPLKRTAGETIGGSMSAGEREAAIIVQQLDDDVSMIMRRKEFMAADALRDGALSLDIEGQGVVNVNFSRHADLTKALASSARWGESGVSPATDLEAWALLVLQHSGFYPTDIVFTPEAWDLFKADPLVKDAIDTRRGGESTIDLGPRAVEGGVYKGRWGEFNLWLYNNWYVDEAGSTQRMLPAHQVLMGSAGIEGVRAYGAIRDPRAEYQALTYYPTSWIENDPPTRFLMTQSAPIVYPARVNASFGATVR